MKLGVKTECAICPTPIWEKVGRNYKKTPQYNECDVKLSNDSLMRIGVCNVHRLIASDDLDSVTKKVHAGWQEEVQLGVGSQDWIRDTGLKLRATEVI